MVEKNFVRFACLLNFCLNVGMQKLTYMYDVWFEEK
jgi:hypothetical protein